MEVSVGTLRDRLSEYLRRAQAGEEVVIISRGKPVARLTGLPGKAGDEETVDRARLRSAPWVRPARRQGGGAGELPEPVELPDGIGLSEVLMGERDDARG